MPEPSVKRIFALAGMLSSLIIEPTMTQVCTQSLKSLVGHKKSSQTHRTLDPYLIIVRKHHYLVVYKFPLLITPVMCCPTRSASSFIKFCICDILRSLGFLSFNSITNLIFKKLFYDKNINFSFLVSCMPCDGRGGFTSAVSVP